ncbi:MAG: CorA family divalent cation transporter [Candidatus Micrarchaeia archaeon]
MPTLPTSKAPNAVNGQTALEEMGFCAVLSRGGETRHAESKNANDFCPMLADASVAWVDYVVGDNFEGESIEVAKTLGFSELLVKNLLKNTRSGYEDFGNEMGLLLPAIRVRGFDVLLDPLLILIRENVIVTLHTIETRRFFRVRKYAETLLRKLPRGAPQNDKITLLLIRLIEENNARNFDHLREIEEHGDELSAELLNTKSPPSRIGNKIYSMKHALIVYLGALWATVDALDSLRYGDADLLTDNPRILDRIGGLIADVNGQIGLSEHMSEVLASGLEVLQSIYNNQLQILNNRLSLLVAYLTILGTALIVPNTLATVASVPVFPLDTKDQWWFLGVIVVSTVVSVVGMWIVVRKSGLMPHRPE